MSVNFIANFASNEPTKNFMSCKKGSPLAGSTSRSSVAYHRRYGISLQLALEQEIDVFWLLKIHSGNFGVLNLQPFYPMLLGALTVIVTVSGAAMLIRPLR